MGYGAASRIVVVCVNVGEDVNGVEAVEQVSPVGSVVKIVGHGD